MTKDPNQPRTTRRTTPAAGTVRWQVQFRRTITGIMLSRVRRHGRGAWLRAVDAPAAVRDYCACTPEGMPDANGQLPTLLDSLDALRTSLADSATDRAMRGGHRDLELTAMVAVPTPRGPRLPPRVRGASAIRTVADLFAAFGLTLDDGMGRLNRTIYRTTACGASISLFGTLDGIAGTIHNPGAMLQLDSPRPGARREVALLNGQLPPDFRPEGFSFHSIVEGSDVELDTDTFYFGRCTGPALTRALETLEAQASFYWDRDNLSLYAVGRVGEEAYRYVQCGWGAFRWDTDGPEDADLRAAFEAWYSTVSSEPDEGTVVTWQARFQFTRCARDSESW